MYLAEIDPSDRIISTEINLLLHPIEMINCKSYFQKTQNDASTTSSCGRRRIIFPTIHEKCSYISNPVIFSRTKLSQHIDMYQKSLTLTSSVESDMPSLTSLSTISESTSTSIPSMTSYDGRIIKDDCNLDGFPAKKAVRFDPRIWVHEFDRTDADKKALWFTVQDLNHFKFGAMQCIMAYQSRVPNMNTQNCSKPIRKRQTGSVLFSHPALGIDNDYDDCEADYHHIESESTRLGSSNSPLVGTIAARHNIVNQFREAVAENEIQNILVVDPQEICLKLYTKGLRRMFPNATIVTARNKEEALHHVQVLSSKNNSGNDFDVVVNDEPKNFADLDSSDLSLFENINQSIKTPGLNIAVVSQRNTTSQRRNGSTTDLIWTKPPPSMNDTLRDLMIKTLLVKRGRTDVAKKLFS